MLDYFPNADHAGIYAAKEPGTTRGGARRGHPGAAGSLRAAQAAGGRRADLAISYEPEVLLARDKGADLVAVGALVQKPLTSLMSVGKAGVRSPRDLAGKRWARPASPISRRT